jgi:serine/threonine-protein kinase
MSEARGTRPLPSKNLVAGRFAVEEQLGRGGMAAVYRVRDVKSDQRFALKRVWSADRKQASKRKALMEREFHTLAQLRHPRIIEVYDYGSDADGPYYTMELLDGTDLEKGGRVPWKEACALLRDIASSLAIVHSRGLIHRDVSGRNVQRTADGRAKLIDFGAMMSMGIATDVIGTAPFMAPEVLQMQTLDARADLFSLGALGYYLLTGRHPYPARHASELRDAWRSRPASPSRAFPEIPAALSALVLQLVALDRAARPQSAAEVMERLCVIGDLAKDELPEVLRGYLTTPTLVGRHRTLLAVRTRMLSVVRGDGCALLLEGAAGSGRSRMLDACVFEAKLLSALVVRANAGDANLPWGVARTIGSQLFALLPAEALEATRLTAGVLAHVIEELSPENNNTVTVSAPERSLILREFRDFVLALAKRNRVLIAIDDVDRIDEPSLAWLSALAAKCERSSLMIVATCASEREAGASGSLDVLHSLAHVVPLPPLEAEETDTLMRSVFGDVPHLGTIAGRIHALAHGNPRATMELAQHIVDRGFARFDAGSWTLPQRLDPSDLPATLAESLARRLQGLSQDARELAELLCIADAPAFSPSMIRGLTRHLDQQRIYVALEQLVAARVLVAAVDDYRFHQRGLVAVLLAAMPEARKLAMHERIARTLAQSGGEVLPRAHHLMAAGFAAEAVALLCSLDLQARLPTLELLERAVAYADHNQSLPARAGHRLRMALLSKAAMRLEHKSFRRCLPSALKPLERDSGLELYRELVNVPEAERLSQALTTQQQRYLATPEHEQVYSVGDAVRELARLIAAACSTAGTTFDLELLEELPSIEPLTPLSPALAIVSQLRAATSHWLSGRAERARQIWEQTLTRMAAADRAGLDDTQFERTQLAVQFVLALYEATCGIDRAEERCKFLESRRAWRVNAWRLRALLHFNQGNAEVALKSSRRADLLQLQDESETAYPGTGVGLQMSACYMAADLLGVKRMLDGLQTHAAQRPGWRGMQLYGVACYRYLSGDLRGALEKVEEGFTIAKPARHVAWGFLASIHIKLLRELGQTERALQRVAEYVKLAEREELSMGQRFVLMESARTLASVGRHAEAIATLEPAIAHVEALGSQGLALGMFYETRASIAIAMRDRAGFDDYSERCAREYEKGQNPALSVKLARLLDEARQADVARTETATFTKALSFRPAPPDQESESLIVSRILECVDASDRARCALTMLLQNTEGYLGYLYGVQRDGRLVALAGLPTTQAEPALEHWLTGWFEAECEGVAQAANASAITEAIDVSSVTLDESGAQTADLDAGEGSGPSREHVDPDGRRFYPVLVVGEEPERAIAAVLVLHAIDARHRRPALRLLGKIAKQLLEHGDVQGLVLGRLPD